MDLDSSIMPRAREGRPDEMVSLQGNSAPLYPFFDQRPDLVPDYRARRMWI